MARFTLFTRSLLMVSITVCCLLATPLTVRAQASPEAAKDASAPPVPSPAEKKSAAQASTSSGSGSTLARPGVNRGTVLQLLARANPMLWPLAACSIFTVGIALERLLALRRRRVIPRDFVDRFLERLAAGKLDRDRALELCKANESPAARVFALAVKCWGQPGATIRQNLSFDAASEVTEMKRNLRVLNGMVTLGPLLGLLGTVVGIIQSFDALGGRLGPARGEALAQGISLALMATAFGLVIAIFAVCMYYYLLNRVDVLTRELDEHARQVVDLVSSEAIRPAVAADRRHGPLPAADPLRQETRIY